MVHSGFLGVWTHTVLRAKGLGLWTSVSGCDDCFHGLLLGRMASYKAQGTNRHSNDQFHKHIGISPTFPQRYAHIVCTYDFMFLFCFFTVNQLLSAVTY